MADKRISIKTTLLIAVMAAAAAFKTAAESFKASFGADESDKAALAAQRDAATAQLAEANAKLADAQAHLASFQGEETLEDHPELVSAMSNLGVTDGAVAPPAPNPEPAPPA
jgi:hypothetical protein